MNPCEVSRSRFAFRRHTVFEVRAADGHSVDQIKMDNVGQAELKNLLPGVYEISEKSVPSLWLLDAPTQFVTPYPNRDHTVILRIIYCIQPESLKALRKAQKRL